MYSFAESESWVQKAKDYHDDANILIDYGKKHGPTSRIYYSAFYCAKALLTLHKIKAARHSSVISLFGRLLVKEKGVDKKFGRFLNKTFNERKKADYDISLGKLNREELKALLRISSEFIQTTQDYIDRIKLSNGNKNTDAVVEAQRVVTVGQRPLGIN